MNQEKLLSVSEIAQELDTGIASTKFLLKRFKKWLPENSSESQNLYAVDTVQMLFRIKEKLDLGILPSDIEKDLETASVSKSVPEAIGQTIAEDLKLSSESQDLIKSLFSDLSHHQQRIASAHEKRAAAEERKAIAIEKRAEAEENKAQAMNNIANALQEMNTLRSQDLSSQQVIHQAASAIAQDEAGTDDLNEDLLKIDSFDEFNESENDGYNENIAADETISEPKADIIDFELDLELSDKETDLFAGKEDSDPLASLLDNDLLDEETDVETQEDLPDLEDLNESDLDEEDLIKNLLDDTEAMPVDEISSLVDEKEESDPFLDNVSLDDLTALVDEQPASDEQLDDLESLVEVPIEETDDLTELVDTPESSTDSMDTDSMDTNSMDTNSMDTDLDDLSLLVKEPEAISEEASRKKDTDLDDLSILVNEDQSVENGMDSEQDDLSLLVADSADTISDQSNLDDLSQLTNSQDSDVDNLSSLVDTDSDDSREKEDINETVAGTAQSVDDLASIVEEPAPKTPRLKPDITPDEDLKKYKATIMKIILQLKSEGLSAAETTQRLNEEKILTLSGKPEWGENAISQIYKFIDAAK